MNDDALPAIWTSDPPADKETLMTAMNAVLEEDRADRDKDRRLRAGFLFAPLALLCPTLIWCAVYGISPLVRGGYALMAVGTALVVSKEWMYLTWSRQALPGPADARSQLQRSTFLLSRQASLARMAALWFAPVFLGTALIGLWLFQQRSATGGSLLWAVVVAGWTAVSLGGMSMGAKLDERRLRMERLLAELT
jgi:hypothetical protein